MSGTPQHDPYGRPGSGPQWPDADAQAPYGQAPDAAAQAPYGRPPAADGQPTAPQHGWDGQAPQQQWNGQSAAPAPGRQAWDGQRAWNGQAPQQPWAGQPQQGWNGQQPGWNGQQQAWPAVAGTPRRPGSITAAFWLILAAGMLTLLSTVLGGIVAGTAEGQAMIEQQMKDSYAQAGLSGDQLAQSERMVQQMMPAMPGVMIGIGVVLFLIYLLIAWRIRNGSRAARTVATVLAALSVLFLLPSLLMGAFDPLGILVCLLGVIGVVVAYRKDATEFMRLKAWERAARR